MLFLAAAFVAGVCLLQTQETLPDFGVFASIAVVILVMACGRKETRTVALLALCFWSGFYYSAWRAESRLSQQLPADLRWRDIVVEGKVHGFPRIGENRTAFDFDIVRAVKPSMPLRLRARLTDYHYSAPPAMEIREGAYLKLKVRIRPPRANINPNGFDYSGYLFARGIRAAGYIRGRDKIEVLSAGGGFRNSLRERAASMPQHGNLLVAFIVGDRSGISDKQWEVFRRTGTAHLLSISGTHITLAAGAMALAAGFLWRRSRRLMRLMPAQKAAILAAIPAAIGYAILAGFGVPVQRSALMFLVAACAALRGGMSSAVQTMAIAAAAVTMADPWAVLSPGFWLSFMLAGAVIAAASHGVSSLIRIQCLVSLFALPLTLWFFNEASLASPVANIVAVPLVGLVALPLALADVFLPGDILWTAAGWVLAILLWFLEWLSAFSWTSWQAAADWWLFIPACIGSMWMLMPRGIPLRWAGLFPVLAMMLWQPPTPPPGAFRLSILDVGQGTAAVVETHSHVMIYDSGPRHAFNIIRRFLRGRDIDMLMVSHDDNDHNGATRLLLETQKPAVLSSSFDSTHPLAMREEYTPCAGKEWEWDGVHFAVLHPPIKYEPENDNAASCVVKITARDGTALLAGDIPEDVERSLVEELPPDDLRAEVLLAAHHGSRYSSAESFLHTVSPQAAIFSAGAGNRFGHPHPEAMARATKAGAEVYRTDQDGAIIVDINDGGIRINTWRSRYHRYWHEIKK